MPASVDLETFRAFVSEGKGMIVDARAGMFYHLGHVPGALNLPRETFAADYARQQGALGPRQAGEVMVYCSDADCPDAAMVADALTRLGFTRVRVYKEGWEEWTQANLPQEAEQKP